MSKNDFRIDPKMLRLNNKKTSSTSTPVHRSSISTNNPIMPIIVEDIAASYNKLGKRFNVNTGSQSIAANGYLTLQVTIPANWGKTMYIDKLRAGTSGTSIVDILATTISGDTTSLTPINTNIGSKNATSVTTVYNSSNPSTTASSLQTFILAGGTYETHFGGRIVFHSQTTAQNYCIRVNNTGTGSSLSMISFSWWEI